jgi:hypothetical protein
MVSSETAAGGDGGDGDESTAFGHRVLENQV